MSGSRVILSDHYSDPLRRLTRRRDFFSERQSAHLKPMGLRKCHPIIVKPLTVRVFKKHPYTLTNFLPEKHSVQTRYISQEIGNGMVTIANKVWVGGSEKKDGVDPN